MLSILAKVYYQVKRNQDCIPFLLEQWKKINVERMSEVLEQCQQ